jgi:hypothetical protein
MAIVIVSDGVECELTIHPKTIYWYLTPKQVGNHYHWFIFTWRVLNIELAINKIEMFKKKELKFNELMDKLK